MTTELTSLPWSTSPITDEGTWRAFMRHARGTGVVREVPTDPDKLNEFEVYADSTGMQVKIKSGVAWVRGMYVSSSAVVTEAIAASHATLDRIDRVVLKLDTVNHTITLEVVTGTAAGSPTAPTLTNTTSIYYVKLAQVSVIHAVTTIASDKITDERDWSTDNLGMMVFVVGDNVNTISAGVKGYIPCPTRLTFLKWELEADASGSIVIDIKKCTYGGFPTTASIAGSDKPTLSSAQKANSTALTGWTTQFDPGDLFDVNVSSATTVKQVTLTLFYVKG